MQFDTAPAYTLPKSLRKTFEQTNHYSAQSPGPMYDTFGLGKKQKSSRFKIGKSNRAKLSHAQNNPGPTDYNPEIKFIQKKISFPKSINRPQINNLQCLDPGYYQPKYSSVKRNNQKYSMGSKYESILEDNKNIPGPGQYQINSLFNSKLTKIDQTNDFGKTKRFKNNKQIIPGPGDYQVIQPNKIKKQINGNFGVNPRSNSLKQLTPGPNQYIKQSLFDQAIKNKLGKSISGRYKNNQTYQNNKLTSNAFGNYNAGQQHNNILKKSASFSIGKSSRRMFQPKNIPGPSQYIKQTYQPKNVFNATIPFSSKKMKIQNEQNPGPGQYQISRKQLKKQFTIPRSKSTNFINSNPGVGRYNVLKNQTNKGIKFANSNRINFVSSNIAGVGDYEILNKINQNITIPKSQRFINNNSNKPGPGDYYIPSSIGKFNNYSSKILKN